METFFSVMSDGRKKNILGCTTLFGCTVNHVPPTVQSVPVYVQDGNLLFIRCTQYTLQTSAYVS